MIGKEKHTSFVTIVNCAAHDMYYELLGNFQIYFSWAYQGPETFSQTVVILWQQISKIGKIRANKSSMLFDGDEVQFSWYPQSDLPGSL